MLVNRKNPEMEYIKTPEIGKVIAQGLASVYLEKPRYPVDYLAKWLLKHCNNQTLEEGLEQTLTQRAKVVKKLTYKKNYREEREKELEKKRLAEVQKHNDFLAVVKDAEYKDELLQDGFCDYVQKYQGLTGVYVATHEQPFQDIGDEDNGDTAHLVEGPLCLTYVATSKNHGFMNNLTLQENEGVTFGLFSQGQSQDNAEVVDQNQDGEGEGNNDEVQEVEKVTPKVYVSDVVREKNMHFFKIPKLGAYLAVLLSYKHCLDPQYFQEALLERLTNIDQRKQQAAQRKLLEEDLASNLKEVDDEEEVAQIQAEHDEQLAQLSVIEDSDFNYTDVNYVVGMDTIGTDEVISELNQQEIVNLVQYFSDQWTEQEKNQLEKDLQSHLEYLKSVDEYCGEVPGVLSTQDDRKNGLEQLGKKRDKKVSKMIDNQLADVPESATDLEMEFQEKVACMNCQKKFLFGFDEEETTQENLKDESQSKEEGKSQDKSQRSVTPRRGKLDQSAVEEEESKVEVSVVVRGPREDTVYKKSLLKLKNYRVLCYDNVLQLALYFLGYTKEQINVQTPFKTNKLDWKRVKNLLDDECFFNKLDQYDYHGPKSKVKFYQMTNWLLDQVENNPVTQDQVDDYNVGLGRVFEWLRCVLQLRVKDIMLRRENSEKLKQDRLVALEDHEQWEVKRQEALEYAQEEKQKDIDARKEEEERKEAERQRLLEEEDLRNVDDLDTTEEEDNVEEDQAESQGDQEEVFVEVEKDSEGNPLDPDKFYEDLWFKKWIVADSGANAEPVIPAEVIDDVDADYEDEGEGEE